VGDASILIGVRVLPENEGSGAVKVGRDEALSEVLRELERGLVLGRPKALRDVRGVATEDGMRVHWAETQRLPRLDRLVGGDGGG